MKKLDDILRDVERVIIVGHVRPDGDCTGACLGTFHYIRDNYPDRTVDICLEDFSEAFLFLKDAERISHDFETEQVYDLCLAIDVSDKERLGGGLRYFESAARTVCIDHHITNEGFADENYIDAAASAASEVVFGMMDEAKISCAAAECLYLGIVHDTGVFKHSNTTKRTMTIAGKLIEKGVNTSQVIDGTFYRKTYVQNQILGRALLESMLFMDGKCIVSVLNRRVLDFYGAKSKDLDGIIDQLRVTEGVECALLLTEIDSQEYKVSLRSNETVDVSRIARCFGGGGHVRAAGCTMSGSCYDVINNLSEKIEEQL